MGSVFILACCNLERQNQPHTVTRHTQQVVSNSVDTLSNQFKPDAGDGGGVHLIPHVGSAFCSSNQDTYWQLCPVNPFLDTQTLGQTRRYFQYLCFMFFLSQLHPVIYSTFHALSDRAHLSHHENQSHFVALLYLTSSIAQLFY